MTNKDQQLERLPTELIQELKAEESVATLIPRSVDQAVLTRAQDQFERRPDRKAAHWFWPAAAAATVVLALVIGQPIFSPKTESRLTDDIDGSGQVDVLDAFALARLRQVDESVTQEQIEALLSRIVSLETGSSI